MTLTLLAAIVALLPVQDTPTRVTGKLPARALCLICSQSGEGEEKPAGAVAYKGRTHYFCNSGEIARFLKDPEAYLPAPVPRPAPIGSLPSLAGEARPVAASGRLTLVDFWATWCVPCVDALPALERLHQRRAPQGLSVVGVSIDVEGAAKVGPFLKKRRTPPTYPILLDTGDAWKGWGVKALPTLVLVRDGQIVRQWSGKIDLAQIEREIEGLLVAPTGGAAPPPAP